MLGSLPLTRRRVVRAAFIACIAVAATGCDDTATGNSLRVENLTDVLEPGDLSSVRYINETGQPWYVALGLCEVHFELRATEDWQAIEREDCVGPGASLPDSLIDVFMPLQPGDSLEFSRPVPAVTGDDVVTVRIRATFLRTLGSAPELRYTEPFLVLTPAAAAARP